MKLSNSLIHFILLKIANTKEHSNSSWETDLFSSFQFGEFKRFIDNNECEEKKRMDMYFFLIFL